MSGTASRGEVLATFPRQRTWLLPALEALQHLDGWLSTEALAAAADHLRVPRSEVWGVATHYPELRLSPPGRRLVRVCVGVSCRVRGSLGLLEDLERRLRVTTGTAGTVTTPDGEVTLERLDCAFACAVAPVAEVAGRRLGGLGPGDGARLLEEAPGDARSGLLLPGASPAPPAAGLPAAPHAPVGPVEHLAALERAARGRERAADLRLSTAVGSCSLALGAAETLAALEAEVARRRFAARVVATGCSGLCWAGPAVTITRPGIPPVIVPRVGTDRVGVLLDAVTGGSLAADPEVGEFLRPQRRVLTGRCGEIDPSDIGEAVLRGSYAALAGMLALDRPEAVIEAVKQAGLEGRGGAYFQAALKWEGARRAAGEPKYLVVNGEEGEPGIFKDRHLMEGDPHRLLEGALLAAYAAGASHVYLYVHGEADLAASRLARAVADARAWRLVGPEVLGSRFSVDVEIRRGAGGFVLGEETALMESIEGRRAMPRAKPPFPVESGLWGRPTVINNVETLCAVPVVAAGGPAAWTALGGGRGTKCFGLSGHVRRPGLAEMEMGATMRDLLDGVGGGPEPGRRWQAALVGGPSGSLLPAARFDEPMAPGGPVTPGTGGVVALDDRAPVRDVVRTLIDFNTRESCGKCTPCREGTLRLRDVLDGRTGGSVTRVQALAEVVRDASLCGLGQAAPLSILAALHDFPEAFTDLRA